jgi:hypothetical protein
MLKDSLAFNFIIVKFLYPKDTRDFTALRTKEISCGTRFL